MMREPLFSVGDRVRHEFAGGYIVTTIKRVDLTYPDDPWASRFIYEMALPDTRDDELLLWDDEFTPELTVSSTGDES